MRRLIAEYPIVLALVALILAPRSTQAQNAREPRTDIIIIGHSAAILEYVDRQLFCCGNLMVSIKILCRRVNRCTG
jgi:hypothetical protein